MIQTTQNTLLAPFEIWEVTLDHSTIKFHQPLVLTPNWMPHDPDEPGEIEYLEIVRPELNIDVYAENRDDLLDALHSNIRMVWRLFVQENESKLIPQTKIIRNNYLAIAEEVADE
jgi:hypothetical protein